MLARLRIPLALSCLLTAALPLAAAPAAAASLQLDRGRNLYTFSYGVGFANEARDGTSLDIPGFVFAYDDVRWGGKWSFGVVLGFLVSSSEDTTLLGEAVQISYRTIPTYAVWRYYFGQPGGRFAASIGAGFGLGFNRIDRSTTLSSAASFGTSIGATIPVGVLFALTDDVYLNASYSFQILNESFFEDDIVHLATIGIVFAKI